MRWLLLLLTVSCQKPEARVVQQGPPLPFIEDDYSRALSEARKNKLPMFVEAWAPW